MLARKSIAFEVVEEMSVVERRILVAIIEERDREEKQQQEVAQNAPDGMSGLSGMASFQ